MVRILNGIFGIWKRKEAEIRNKAGQQAKAILKGLPGFEYSDDALRVRESFQEFQLQETYVLKSEMVQRAEEELNFVLESLQELCSVLEETPYEIKDGIVVKKENAKVKIYPALWSGEAYRATDCHLQQYSYIDVEDIKNLYGKICSYYNALTRQQAILNKGEDGERYVEQHLSMFRNKYYIRQNILLPSVSDMAQTSETDIYIITAKGILVCEVKNWGSRGQLISIGRDGRWAKRLGGNVETLKSPVLQNSRHCMDTEDYLLENGIRNVRLFPVVIIANEEVEIDNMSSNVVIRVSELYNFIINLDGAEIYSDNEQRKIAGLLDQCRVSERKFKILHTPDKDGLICAIREIGFQYNEGIAYKKSVSDKLHDVSAREYRAVEKLKKRKKLIEDLFMISLLPIGLWVAWKAMWFALAVILSILL